MKKAIKNILENTTLQSQEETYQTPNHGSSTGEMETITVYYNPHKFNYTNKREALRGHCYKEVDKIIDKLLSKC